MQKFRNVLLASDFDNTLVYTQGALERGEDIPPMSARNREAVDYFLANGGFFTVATGRALPAFAQFASALPVNAPCVIANGAAIYDFARNRYVETAFLDADIYDHVDALLARFPRLCFEVYHDDRRIHSAECRSAAARTVVLAQLYALDRRYGDPCIRVDLHPGTQ